MILSKESIYKIKSRLFTYSPNLKQSWWLCAFIMATYCIVIIVKWDIPYILNRVNINILKYVSLEWMALLGDLLVLFAVGVYVNILSNNNYKPVTVMRQSSFLWLLLAPFILSVGFASELLSMWFPDYDLIANYHRIRYDNNLPIFLSSVIIMPILYEWICRGIILKGLLVHYSPLKAILWSSIMFGVLHNNPRVVVSTFFIGLAIGWVYWQTRSLWFCIFMHSVFNIALFIITLFYYPNLPDYIMITNYATIAEIVGGYYIYVVALFVCVLTGILIKKIVIPYNVTPEAQNPH